MVRLLRFLTLLRFLVLRLRFLVLRLRFVVLRFPPERADEDEVSKPYLSGEGDLLMEEYGFLNVSGGFSSSSSSK